MFLSENEIDKLMDEIAELQHLVASSRNLLDRLDEAKNSIRLEKKHGISLYNPPDFDSYHSIHFQFQFDLRLSKLNEIDNIVYMVTHQQ